ncbi:aldehyde dehydrogenase family protein [Streptomyces sp. M19]
MRDARQRQHSRRKPAVSAPVWSVDPEPESSGSRSPTRPRPRRWTASYARRTPPGRAWGPDGAGRPAAHRGRPPRRGPRPARGGGGRRDGPRPGAARRRADPQHLPAAGLRRRRRRGRLPRRTDRPRGRHPDPPWPDLRRYKLPLGVVGVYSASNFPSRSPCRAATPPAPWPPAARRRQGAPRPPATSELSAALLRRAAERVGVDPAVVALVHGFEAGVALIAHPLLAAAGFTGSIRGGRALFDAAAAAPADPVLRRAGQPQPGRRHGRRRRGAGRADRHRPRGLHDARRRPVLRQAGAGAGPEGASGDRLVEALTDAVSDTEAGCCWTPACGTPSSRAYARVPNSPTSRRR